MRITTAIVSLLGLCACAKTGFEDRPLSQVRITANHHMFSFRGLSGLTAVQVKPDEVFTDDATFSLASDSTYTVTRPAGTSSPETYALEDSGELTILLSPPDPHQPTPVFRGAYGLEGDTGLYFFTDRLSSASSPSLGVYWGTRVEVAAADLSGDWHVLSLHVIFSNSALPDPDNIARAAFGSLTAAAGNPGDLLALTGSGSESTSANLDLSGSIQDLGDGSANLTVTYQQTGLPATADNRVFLASHAGSAVLAVDEDETDGEAGLLAMLRKRTGLADPMLFEGTYMIGGQTLFPNPTNPGSDAALGRLTITAAGAFRLDMTGSRGINFTYQGTYVLDDDGRLTLTVAGTNETWLGAVDQDYNTVVIVDPVIEQRANNTPELSLYLALRPTR